LPVTVRFRVRNSESLSLAREITNLGVDASHPKKKPADVISVRRRGFEFRCPSGLAGSERLTVE